MRRLDLQINGGGVEFWDVGALVVAGFTGRDPDAVKRHVDELAAHGVPAPARVPEFYVLPTDLLTTSEEIEVDGARTSGEVEPVLFLTSVGVFVGVGSDHTDRERERESIASAKAACPKIASRTIVAYEDVADRWDELIVRSHVDASELYQEARLSELLPVDALVDHVRGIVPSGIDVVVFCGTVPLMNGDFSFSDRFAGELVDRDGSVLASYSYRVRRRQDADR